LILAILHTYGLATYWKAQQENQHAGAPGSRGPTLTDAGVEVHMVWLLFVLARLAPDKPPAVTLLRQLIAAMVPVINCHCIRSSVGQLPRRSYVGPQQTFFKKASRLSTDSVFLVLCLRLSSCIGSVSSCICLW
jgi:hypothetical protein